MSRSHEANAPSTGGIVDHEVAGKRVLLVTSDPAVTCVEVSRRGARDVVVVDVDPVRVGHAHAHAGSLGLSATFHCMNIEEQAPEGPFDVVLCLDVLQSVRNPMQVIDRLIAACRERLVLEVPGPASAEARRYLQAIEVPWWQRSILARLPVVLVGRNGTTVTHPEAKFYFSMAALRNLLVHHRRHFAEVRIEEVDAGRIRVSAIRHARIERLIVVAGPSAGGKTSFIRSLENNEDPELSSRLGIDDIASWTVASKANVMPPDRATDRLIMHYDFLRPWRRDARIFERDEALDVLEVADEIVFVTMWTDPGLLRERVRDRIARLVPTRDRLLRKRIELLFYALRSARLRRFSIRKVKDLLSAIFAYGPLERIHLAAQERHDGLYADPAQVLDLYRRWFAFCGRFAPRAQWVADTSWSDTELIPLAEWNEQRGDGRWAHAASRTAPGFRRDISNGSVSERPAAGHAAAKSAPAQRSASLSLTHIDFQPPSPGPLDIIASRFRTGQPTRIRLAGHGVRTNLTLEAFMAGCGSILTAAAEVNAARTPAAQPDERRAGRVPPRFGDLRLEPGGGAAVHPGGGWPAWTLDREDFARLAEGAHQAILRILHASDIDGRRFERSFLGKIAPMAHKITRLDERVVPLRALRVIEYTPTGWRPVPVAESLPARYLQGDIEPYVRYVERHGSAHHTPDNLESLKRSILERGYPAGGHIVVFGDERYIRDGQHRAAVLFSLLGLHAEIPVMRVEFSGSFEGWRMTKRPLLSHEGPVPSGSPLPPRVER